MIQQIGCMIA